jgi:hypothetical protein
MAWLRSALRNFGGTVLGSLGATGPHPRVAHASDRRPDVWPTSRREIIVPTAAFVLRIRRNEAIDALFPP